MLPSEMTDPLLLGRAWRSVLGRLDIDPSAGDTFALRGTRILRFEGRVAVIEARSASSCEWMASRLKEPIRAAIVATFNEELQVQFVPPQPAESVEALWGAVETEPLKPTNASNVRTNCAFTFERYITSNANQVAFESCKSLLGGTEVPISDVVVVWGAPGMGKTHLLHALAAAAADGGSRVACLNAEQFTTRYQYALRARDVRPFQEEVREVDLLLVDDLQYLEGKAATLNELVSSIDAVCNGSGHVVIASERHPGQLGLPPRLLSRLSGGVITHVDTFPSEDRLTFVRRVTAEYSVELPEFAVRRIVAIEAVSVRVLQGAVHAAIALKRANCLGLDQLDRELIRLALPEASSVHGKSPSDVLSSIAHHFQTSLEEMAGRSRKPALTRARAVAATILQREGSSLREIGAILGNRDRSTIGDLVDRGRAIIAEEPSLHLMLADALPIAI